MRCGVVAGCACVLSAYTYAWAGRTSVDLAGRNTHDSDNIPCRYLSFHGCVAVQVPVSPPRLYHG
jgi:hypothetical protein